MSTANPLLSLLATNPHPLLQPTSEHNAAALALAKLYLDPLAQSISVTQTERQKENRRKRKRGDREGPDTKPLQLKRLHVDGFKVDQVHEQVKRVLDAAKKEIRLGLKSLEESWAMNANGMNGAKAVR
jgi:U3 small nucleolar RNA-associated protein MPP10